LVIQESIGETQAASKYDMAQIVRPNELLLLHVFLLLCVRLQVGSITVLTRQAVNVLISTCLYLLVRNDWKHITTDKVHQLVGKVGKC
jgi:hypothetical protein